MEPLFAPGRPVVSSAHEPQPNRPRPANGLPPVSSSVALPRRHSFVMRCLSREGWPRFLQSLDYPNSLPLSSRSSLGLLCLSPASHLISGGNSVVTARKATRVGASWREWIYHSVCSRLNGECVKLRELADGASTRKSRNLRSTYRRSALGRWPRRRASSALSRRVKRAIRSTKSLE